MKEDDALWKLIREGAPLPEAPDWFSARTMARMRAETARPHSKWLVPSWVWMGCSLLMIGFMVASFEVHQQIMHDRQVTYAALDILAGKDQPQDQEEAWLTSY